MHHKITKYEFNESFGVLNNKIDTVSADLSEEIVHVKNVIDDDIKKVERNCLKEMADRQSRQNKLIIYGINTDNNGTEYQDESGSESTSNKNINSGRMARNEAIEKKIHKLLANTDVNYESFSFKTLGTEEKSPVCVKFNSSATREAVFSRSMKMRKSPELTGIVVLPDLTAAQREQKKLLKVQLKEKVEMGELDWTIRLVNGRYIITKKRVWKNQLSAN